MENKETLSKRIEDIPKLRFPEFKNSFSPHKLEELCSICTGKLDANEMEENGIYDFYTSGIQKYKINTYAFKGPAITIAGNGANVGYTHLADGKFNAYQRTYVLKNFKVNRNYLYSFINKALPIKINKEVRSGNIPYIVFDMLAKLNVMLPEYSEQEKIGLFLSKIDSIIELEEKKILLLNKYKEGLLSYIFNDFSCVKSYNFKEIFVKYNEKNKSNYPQYTIGVNGIKLLESDRNNYDISNHKLFSPDSLILGIGINEVGISDCFGCCSPIYLTYKINTEIVNPVFAKYYIPIVFKKNKSLITRKSTRRDFELTKDVEDLLITIPLINEQDEIAKILSTFDELIEKENNILSLLKKYKQGLLQQMFI